MTDDQLADYLGIPSDHLMKATVIESLSPAKRACYERMASLETELALWQDGLGPKPVGVLIDTERSTSRRRSWR
jgi:hypothetical protein